MNLLFEIEQNPKPQIEGLDYIQNFITKEEEKSLLNALDQEVWLTDLKRRVQHYGYKYDYKARTVAEDAYLGPLPEWINTITHKLPFHPDQAIVNEYLPGQGISAHIDCIPCFGKTIVSLTLGAGTTMQFKYGERNEELYIEPCSLIVLSGPARYDWTHAIPARKSDIVSGMKLPRERRISLTFRTVQLSS